MADTPHCERAEMLVEAGRGFRQLAMAVEQWAAGDRGKGHGNGDNRERTGAGDMRGGTQVGIPVRVTRETMLALDMCIRRAVLEELEELARKKKRRLDDGDYG